MKLKVIILYLVKETIVYVFWVYSGRNTFRIC